MVVDNPVVQKIQVLMDHAERVEVHHKRKGQQERSRSVRPKTSKLANEIKPTGKAATSTPSSRKEVKPTGKAATSTPSSRKEVGSKTSWWCNRCNLPHLKTSVALTIELASIVVVRGIGREIAQNCSKRPLGGSKPRGTGGVGDQGRGGPTLHGARTGGLTSVHAVNMTLVP